MKATNMKNWIHSAFAAVLLVSLLAPALSQQAHAEDLKEAIPSDMFLAVHAKHNPERDYQADYYREIWKTVEQTRIVERIARMIQSKMADDDVSKMLAFRNSVREALKEVEWEQLTQCTEVAYGQKLQGVLTQNILIMRFPGNSAASLADGIHNLLKMADEAAGDDINIIEQTIEGAECHALQLPPGVPLSPVFGVRNDLFIYSSSPEFASRCLKLLDDPGAESKFDDERVTSGLTKLPAAEDALVFFDGRALAEQLKGVASFVRSKAADDDEAQRFATLLDTLLSEASIIDHEVTVEYTDGFRNHSAAFGKAAAGYKSSVFGQMVSGQKSFREWSQWVPADAGGFSLQSGVNFHPLHNWVTTTIPELFPGSEEAFFELREAQEQYGINLDKDILQNFSGESVSIELPGPLTPLGPSSKSVVFLRCSNPERALELINRGIKALQEIPQIRNQGLTLQKSKSLEGFHELRAGIFMMMGGMTPVFGFRDGWMIMGSHTDAVEKVLLTKGGESETIATSDTFLQFGLDVSGDVTSISYANTGSTIRQMASGLQQAGAMIPMVLAMSGRQENMSDLEPLQDILSLLPSIGQIVGKFDFIESTLSVTQPGPEADTWIRRSATMIRPPDPVKPVSAENETTQ